MTNINEVSLIQPEVQLKNQTLVLKWRALQFQGNVDIYLSTTNLCFHSNCSFERSICTN